MIYQCNDTVKKDDYRFRIQHERRKSLTFNLKITVLSLTTHAQKYIRKSTDKGMIFTKKTLFYAD